MQIFKKLNPGDESPDPVINYQTSIASTFVSIHEQSEPVQEAGVIATSPERLGADDINKLEIPRL